MPQNVRQQSQNAPLRAAIVYDFDGTLARGNIQERSFIPDCGMDHDAFWLEVKKTARACDADDILVYMHKMVEKARELGRPVTRAQLQQHGSDPDLFDGLDHWFDRMNEFAADIGLDLEHYVISSGIYEMIEGSPIFRKFQQVYASRFLYDAKGHAVWPALAINYTSKTQFLYSINKGVEHVWDSEAINRWMPEAKRPVPFERMIFIGDGDTDIPSMKTVMKEGGCSIAVLDPALWSDELKVAKLHKLIAEDRVRFAAMADYQKGEQLDVIVKGALHRIALRAGVSKAEAQLTR
ncbi:MAG: haloacid dehalogenase-like hydrolase [Hyphomonadaceae bacterium]|nr:haloacid dehalogenase-like hydrolase [Hyphomonadaceae bacterium]